MTTPNDAMSNHCQRSRSVASSQNDFRSQLNMSPVMSVDAARHATIGISGSAIGRHASAEWKPAANQFLP